MSHTQGILEKLSLEEHETLRKNIEEHRAFLTPARRVPHDVWSEIFHHCVQMTQSNHSIWSDRRDINPLSAFRPHNAPALLLRICNDWTDIALSSPELWSSITLKPFRSDLTPVATSLVQTWLRRSQQASLTVFLVLRNSYNEELSFVNAAVSTVFEQSHRWKSLFMKLASPSCMEVFPLLKDNLPMLHELEITYLTDSTKGLSRPVEHLKNIPNLRRVKLGGLSPSADVKLPLAQLTYFSNSSGRGGSLAEFLTLLELAPVLRGVEWLMPRVQDPQFLSSERTIHHSCLRFLYIYFNHDPGNLFDHLSLPSLHGLTIQQSGYRSCYLPFGQFFSRCPSLEHLYLSTAGLECFPHSELVTHLKALSSLSHLTLTNSSLMATTGIAKNRTSIDQLLQSLHVSEKDEVEPALLPLLKNLIINCDEYSVSGVHKFVGKFMDMVESRCKIPIVPSEVHVESTISSKVSRLGVASLAIRGYKDITVDITGLERLRNMKTEGLKVQLSYHYGSWDVGTHLV